MAICEQRSVVVEDARVRWVPVLSVARYARDATAILRVTIGVGSDHERPRSDESNEG